MTELNSIEVRGGKKKFYLIILFVWVAIMTAAFLIPEQRKGSVDFFFGKWSFAKVPTMFVFIGWPCFCLFNLFDKRLKAKIDKDGIWSLKYGTVLWEDIWYFYSTFYIAKYEADSYDKLHLKLKDTETRLDKEIILKFQRMDKTFEEIRTVVEYYGNKYEIEDLGHENEL